MLEGGDDGAEDWLCLLELELSKSVELAGGEDPRGEGF